jgi:hypothetical protein
MKVRLESYETAGYAEKSVENEYLFQICSAYPGFFFLLYFLNVSTRRVDSEYNGNIDFALRGPQ